MRWKSSGALALGILITVLIGSGLFALASDTIISEGNKVESSTFNTSHDLKVARVAIGASCASASYGDGPIGAAIDSTSQGTINLNIGSTIAQQDDFCLKNVGWKTGVLTVTFTSPSDTEVGTCATTESSNGDATCPAGSAGELSPILDSRINFLSDPSTAISCGPGGVDGTFASFTGAARSLDTTMAGGDICRLYVSTSVRPASTPNDRAKAQTDRVQWDIAFTLADI